MSEPTAHLKHALLALADGQLGDTLPEAHWRTIYDTLHQLARKQAGDPALWASAVDRKIDSWLCAGKLAGYAFELPRATSAHAWVRRALRNQYLDEVRRESGHGIRSELPIEELTAGNLSDDGAKLDPTVHELIDHTLPPHLRDELPRQDPPKVQRSLHTRYDVVRHRTTMAEVIRDSLVHEPDPKDGAERRRNERLMRAQRRATETCAKLGRILDERAPPHEDGPKFTHLADLLRHKKANCDGGAS